MGEVRDILRIFRLASFAALVIFMRSRILSHFDFSFACAATACTAEKRRAVCFGACVRGSAGPASVTNFTAHVFAVSAAMELIAAHHASATLWRSAHKISSARFAFFPSSWMSLNVKRRLSVFSSGAGSALEM